MSAAFGISENYYRGEEKRLAGTGQRSHFSGDVCRDISYLIMRVIEKENVGMKITSKIALMKELIIAVLLVDNADMIAEGDMAEENMQEMLETCN